METISLRFPVPGLGIIAEMDLVIAALNEPMSVDVRGSGSDIPVLLATDGAPPEAVGAPQRPPGERS